MARPKIKQTKEQKELYNDLKRLVDKANKRIKAIENIYGKNAWGVRTLTEKLANENLLALTKKGRISLSKKQSAIQLRAIKKEVETFLNMKGSSTLRGIKKTKAKTIETLKIRLSTDKANLSDKEAESLFDIFQDREVNRITSFMYGSDVIALVNEAREKNWSYDTFDEQIVAYKKANKGKPNYYIISKLYTKYVVGYQSTNQNIINDIVNKIEDIKTINDIENIYTELSSYYNQNKLTDKEYYYLSDLLEQKRNEIL